jgi:outer membrane lipoprotein-sorting protein
MTSTGRFLLTGTLLGTVLCCFSASTLAADNELGWTLESALKQLERQTRDFETALADIEASWSDENGAVTRTAKGRIYINNDGVVRINVSDPDEKVILATKSQVMDYDPVRALVDEYSLRKHKDRLEPFLRVGFTHSGKDLRDDFVLTLIGEDRIGSQRTLGLELTPTRNEIRESVSRLQVWIDQASWMPVQLVIEHVSSGETLTVNFLGLARNLKLNPELFKDDWPKGTQKLKR